jgi:hypothetical protein
MRSHRILITTLAAASLATSAGALAQITAAEAAAKAQEQAREQARQNAITDRYLTAVPVEMASKVDTKNAAVGQEVSARTLAEARLANGTVLPKGTKLVGHVIQAKPGGQDLGRAVLTLTFDVAEVKPGQNVPVRSVIRAVAPNVAAAANREMMAAPAMPLPSAASPGTPGRGSRGGVAGGMPGTTMPSIGTGGGAGGVGGYPGSNNPQVGMPGGGGAGTSGGGMGGPAGMPGSTGPSIGDTGPVASGPLSNLGSLGGPAVGMADRRVDDAGDSVSGAPKSTGLPGVMLWATPTASGMLTAFGKNVSLESGVQLTLGVITR